MFQISPRLHIPLEEIELSATRSQGAGGQHVNRTESAVQLRFDVPASSLPQDLKQRLLARRDARITREGVIVIKAQQHRSQALNREAALERLRQLIAAAGLVPRSRKPTRPTRASQHKRLEGKTRHGRLKTLRGRIDEG